MNTALQCLINCTELSDYFFNNKYLKSINKEKPTLVLNSYVNLINEYFGFTSNTTTYNKEDKTCIRPETFKRSIATYNKMYSGYQQQDAMEFITYLLDGLHETLNFNIEKIAKSEDKEETTMKLVLERNPSDKTIDSESEISNLFKGKFRSSLYCPSKSCNNIFITKEDFFALTLPIELPKVETTKRGPCFEVFTCFIPYMIKASPILIKLKYKLDSKTIIMQYRNQLSKILKIHPMSFFIVRMNSSNDFGQFLSNKIPLKMPNTTENKIFLFLFQINPIYFYSKENYYYTNNESSSPYIENCLDLLPTAQKNVANLKQYIAYDYEEETTGVCDNKPYYYSGKYTFIDSETDEEKTPNIKDLNFDNNHGFDTKEWIKVMIYLKDYTSNSKSTPSVTNRSRIHFQRLLYIKKSWTTQNLHYELFKYIFPIIAKKEKLSDEKIEDDISLLEKYFSNFFPNYTDSTNLQDLNSSDTFKTHENKKYPYRVRVIRSEGAIANRIPCFLCNSSKCHGCLLPFSTKLTINDILSKYPKSQLDYDIDNNFLYFGPKMQENLANFNRDFILELTWLNEYREYVKN